MTPDKLDFWIRHNYNVLFKGKHGVGKTARIVDAFNKNNLKWKYFSASTLDPWVDFVGVPKEVTDANGKTYLDLVRPKHFAEDDVEAIFLDEYNRAPAKIRNATMELIQFKSINGKKFNNLRFVWVAVNPDEDEKNPTAKYDVEIIDPAQKDRFEIQVDIPYKPDVNYFTSKYGSDIGKVATNWWNDLSEEDKNYVSPRRLDYVIQMYLNRGDLKDVVPARINTSKLVVELKNGTYRDQLEKVYRAADDTASAIFINETNNYTNTIKYVLANQDYLRYFFPFISDERRSVLITTEQNACKHAISEYDTYKVIIDRLAANNNMVKNLLQKHLQKKQLSIADMNKLTFSGKLNRLNGSNIKNVDLSAYNDIPALLNGEASQLSQTAYRRNAYKMIYSYIYYQRGYMSPAPSNPKYRPLDQSELILTLDTLNLIIERTTAYDNFASIHSLYGFVCGELLKKFGYRQAYENLSKGVLDFIARNSEHYI